MVELYTTLIIAKKRTYISTPESKKVDVLENLNIKGYDENGDKIAIE